MSKLQLTKELARLEVKNRGHERQEDELRLRLPFLKPRRDFIPEKCDYPDGNSLPFAVGERGTSLVVCRSCCYPRNTDGRIALAILGEARRISPWGTIQRWRKMKMNGGAGIFDGSQASRRQLRELALAGSRALSHGQRMKVAVTCDAMAVNADVTVWPDGTVNGLSVPMHRDPALVGQRVADPDASARSVGGVDGTSFTVTTCL
jgi:hypothetical protein